MSLLVAAVLLAPLVTGMPGALNPRQDESAKWTAGAYNPSDGLWGTAITAAGGKFWLYRATASYCPPGVAGLDCSAYPGTTTEFLGGNPTVSLAVAVPGGQQGESIFSVPQPFFSLRRPLGRRPGPDSNPSLEHQPEGGGGCLRKADNTLTEPPLPSLRRARRRAVLHGTTLGVHADRLRLGPL